MDIRLLQPSVQEMFAGTEFIISGISNTGGIPRNNLFQIEHKNWCKNSRFEFHYEVQQDSKDKDKLIIRIDCHFRPYEPYKEGRHRDDEHEELISILKTLSEIPSNAKTRTNFRKDSLWGVKWKLSPTLSECAEEIYRIVFDTWQTVDELVLLSRNPMLI